MQVKPVKWVRQDPLVLKVIRECPEGLVKMVHQDSEDHQDHQEIYRL